MFETKEEKALIDALRKMPETMRQTVLLLVQVALFGQETAIKNKKTPAEGKEAPMEREAWAGQPV